ncbi:hypothetical protein, partial [Maribellus maritimus]|uniref:hypothetical protein n=1 Tax=Maribellus maritimus TaxID=2870838 RepID=UPI001EEA9E24
NRNATRNHNVNNRKQTLSKNFQCGILYLKWYQNLLEELSHNLLIHNERQAKRIKNLIISHL